MTYELNDLILDLMEAGFNIRLESYLESDDEYPPPAGTPSVHIIVQLGNTIASRYYSISQLDTHEPQTMEMELISMAIEAIRAYKVNKEGI